MLTLQIKEKEIENLTPEEEFVRGTVGAKCQINFDEFWQSYNKYIVFKRVGYEPINFMVDTLENEIEIPYTILAESGEFKIGVFGITETETLPTLYSKDIKILYGTDTHGTTPPTYIPSEIDQLRLSKQDKLVSGENIKTVNGESVLGSGNIKIQVEVDQIYSPTSANAQSGIAVAEAVAPKLDKPSMPPAVGNILKVLSLNEDGTFTTEWADNSNDWVLVARGEVTEEVVGLKIDKDMNGNDFKLTELHFRIRFLSSTGRAANAVIAINDKRLIGTQPCLLSSENYTNPNYTQVINYDGREFSMSVGSASAGGVGSLRTWTNALPFFSVPPIVKSIAVEAVNSSNPNIAGGTYELWGRVAK